MSEENQVVALVFGVHEKEWDYFLEVMDDSDTNYDTWAEWKQGIDHAIMSIESQGGICRIVYPDIDDFLIWCKRNGKERISAVRSDYVGQIGRV